MSDPAKTEMVAQEPSALAKQDYGIDVGRVVAMRAAVVEIMQKVMKEGVDYGEIPGTTKEGAKPKKPLLQPGAEVLCQVFRLRPEYEEVSLIEREDFLFVKVRCKLYNSVTGELVGEAIGSANSREEKYVAQVAAKLCPTCGKPTIFKSKQESGGWFCWAKKGGCGATFADEDKKLLDQTGTVSTDRVWGLYHTLESIAQKRAHVRATRTATACSNIFTDPDEGAGDDERGQTGTQQHTRTSGTKPATATPTAGATEVQKLTQALITLGIGTAVDQSLPKDEQTRLKLKARLSWANGHLAEAGEELVQGFMELTPQQVQWLIGKATRGECPTGW